MSKKLTVVQAAKQFDNALKRSVAGTVKDEAPNVCAAILAEYAGYDETDMASAKATAEKMAKHYPKAGRAARTTEWKDFVFSTVNYDLSSAINRAGDKLTSRVKLFRFAKELHRNNGDYRKALTIATAPPVKGSKGGNNAKPITVFENAVARMFKVQTTAKNLVAFRKDLAALCKKHGIEVKS